MKDEIERRFGLNLGRGNGLIAAYEAALPGTSGRPSVATTDILRGAVVFLHASLEDLLRSILEWKLPLATPEHLQDVPLEGEKLRRYTLGDVAKHRGKTVDALIEQSATTFLLHASFNNVEDVAKALAKSDVDATAPLDARGSDLAALMSRRHWIVHRADRNQAQGAGRFLAKSLAPSTVVAWVESVKTFGKEVLALL